MKRCSFLLTACCLLLLTLAACGPSGDASTEEIVETAAVEAVATEVPTLEPTPIPPTPTPEPTQGPAYEGPIPEGARARIGRGVAVSMSLSPDGESMAVGSSIGVYLYRTDFMVSEWFAPVDLPVLGTAFSQDGSQIAAQTNLHIYILDAATGELIRERISNSDADGVAAFSLDGSQLATTRRCYSVFG